MANRKPAEHKLVAKAKDYKQVFSSQAGERVLHDLIQFSGMLSVDLDPNKAVFNNGMRNIVIMVLKQLNTDPSALMEHIRRIEEERNRK